MGGGGEGEGIGGGEGGGEGGGGDGGGGEGGGEGGGGEGGGEGGGGDGGGDGDVADTCIMNIASISPTSRGVLREECTWRAAVLGKRTCNAPNLRQLRLHMRAVVRIHVTHGKL